MKKFISGGVGEVDLSPAEEADVVAKQAALTTEMRLEQARIEAERRIYSVFDQHAQMNLMANHGAGLLSSPDDATYLAGLLWIASVRGTWEALAAGSDDIKDDANWPAPTQAMIDLGAAF